MESNSSNRISVEQAAKLLGASPQFIRIGLQQGKLDFGMAVKMSRYWTYVITKQKFEEKTGIKVD
jgi:hypothetical protein|nr:MAG TPA: Pyocin activator protein PrtN [Caudoviricetes sp.]